MNGWKRISSSKYELIPDGSSRFILSVCQDSSGAWQAFVSEEGVDEGRKFVSALEAREAAIAEYDSYWADFEESSDGY